MGDVSGVITIIEFSTGSDFEHWFSVNDVVMGGQSGGSLVAAEGELALFTGVLSAEKGSGFASVRTRPRDWGLGGTTGIRLRVRGDGRTYQFRVRADDEFDGVTFRHEFATTPDRWLEIDLPHADFQATFRGRVQNEIPPPEPSKIRQLGLLVTAEQPGQFSLYIDRIDAYS